ncbi:MAG: sigma-70 family RNA polymerase sigma factor [Terriglobia bacterium]
MNCKVLPANQREESIVKWLPLARMIAASEFRRLGTLTRLLQIEFDDLFQTAAVGLITAFDRFDPELSAPKTYFSRRIRGAILDFERSFPFFKNGEAIERVDEAELAFLPAKCVDLERTEARIDFERLVQALSDKQQSVIGGIIFEIPQHLMAQRLGVNESRISQIKREGLAALRCMVKRQVA